MQALGSGYNAKQILSYLSQHNPKLAAQVSSALNAGHTIEHVLNFISRNEKKMGKLAPQKSQTGNIYKQAQSSIHPSLTGMAKFAGTAALAAGGAYALSRAAPQLFGRGAIPGAQQTAGQIGFTPPSQPGPTSPGISVIPKPPQAPQSQTAMPQNTGTAPNSGSGPLGMGGISPVQQNQPQAINQASQPPLGNQVAPNIPQSQPVAQPQGIVNPKEYLERRGLLKTVNDSLSRKNTPEQVAIEIGIKGNGKSSIDPELLANIDAYAKEAKTEQGPMVEQPSQELYKGQEAERQPIEENIVVSPQGIGEVVTSRNGKSIIEVDGKKHQVEDKDLLKPPKEAAIEALELIKGFTPEEMRSTHHMLNAYDEGEKKGFFVFHNGTAYVVDDISPEEYKELSEEVEKAKTTGETIIGKWASGEGSRGAGYNKVVKGVRERKVVPELKKKFRKLKVGYNLLAEWQRLLNEK